MIITEGHIRAAVAETTRQIIMVPKDCKINKKHLGALTNDEYVSSLQGLHTLIKDMYIGVQKSPLDWSFQKRTGVKVGCQGDGGIDTC